MSRVKIYDSSVKNKFKREILLLHKQGPKVIQSHGECHSTYDPTQIL